MYFLAEPHETVLDRAVDTPGYGKYVVDGFNAVQKQYLDIFLRMPITLEVDKIDSKRTHVDDMTQKVKVSFAEEHNRLLNLSDEVDTKGNKKHAKNCSKIALKAQILISTLRRIHTSQRHEGCLQDSE